jgi:hypothetical protein
VPPIQPKPLLRLVHPVRPDHLRQPRIRRRKLLILLGGLASAPRSTGANSQDSPPTHQTPYAISFPANLKTSD